MKKTFRFMVMAIAAIVMAGTTVACDPMDKGDEKQEQTGDNTENEGTENEGTENEGEVPAALTLDGKQWICPQGGDMAYCFDFGVTESGMYFEGYTSLDPTSTIYYKFSLMGYGEYIVEPETETSGTITVESYGTTVEYPYRDLTATSVMIDDTGMGMYSLYTIPEQLIVEQEVSEE